VPWPIKIVVLVVAVGAAFLVLEAWAAGVRLTKIMTEWGERSAAEEAAKAAQRQPIQGDDPTVLYLQPGATFPGPKTPPDPKRR
jgi:hypothetical protein